MTYLSDILSEIDALYPNNYETSTKISWINELETIIRSEIKKLYGIINISPVNGVYTLPDNIRFENIEFVIINGKKLKKSDLKIISGNNFSCNNASDAKVVYLSMPTPHRIAELELASPFLGGNYIMFNETNVFNVGDKLSVGDKGSYVAKSITKNEDDYYIIEFFDADFTEEFLSGDVVLKKENILEAEDTYKNIYTYYVCCKIDFYNKDIAAYNNSLLLFDSAYKSYEKHYKESSATESNAKFKNLW